MNAIFSAYYPSNNTSFSGPDGGKIFLLSFVAIAIMIWLLNRRRK